MFATWVRFFYVGNPKQVVNAGVVVVGKGNKHVSRNITFTHFVVGVTDLCTLQIVSNVFLEFVCIFTQMLQSAG